MPNNISTHYYQWIISITIQALTLFFQKSLYLIFDSTFLRHTND